MTSVEKPPVRVFLFSGHMVDAPGRAVPRFPASAVPAVAKAIDRVLQAFGANANDLALSQAAAGGDILFLEASQRRGVRCEILLPLEEQEFVNRSINPVAEAAEWRQRFFAVTRGPRSVVRYMPHELRTGSPESNAFERCNRWLLDTATGWGVERLCTIALWDGSQPSLPGGTAQMVAEAKRFCATVTWVDTNEFLATMQRDEVT